MTGGSFGERTVTLEIVSLDTAQPKNLRLKKIKAAARNIKNTNHLFFIPITKRIVFCFYTFSN